METELSNRDPGSPSGGGSPRRRVLVVDNSADLAQALVAMIDIHNDLESVGYLSTGAEALALAQHNGIDVMVLDLGLADCNGFTLLERLRREHPKVKVVIYSGHVSAEVDAQAKRRGAAGCVCKGDDLDNLLAAIRAA